MRPGGYFDSPWPAEDGGPQRLQTAPIASAPGLNLRPGERLACTTRHTLLSTMTVLGAPGEVYLLTHSALRARLGLATTACVEKIDPVSLQPLARSPRLPGGPMWPGGMAVHRNGDLFVVYGRYLHRLNRQCQTLASLQLPVDAPYNSFVVLDNGLIVTKNLSDTVAARLTVVDPATTARACADLDCPEPSIARLSAMGNTVYVVGVRSIFRYHWSDADSQLVFDADWRFDYIGATGSLYNLQRQATAWITETAQAQGRTLTPEQLNQQVAATMGLPAELIANPPDRPSAVDDVTARGTEIEVNYNPNSFWTVKANARRCGRRSSIRATICRGTPRITAAVRPRAISPRTCSIRCRSPRRCRAKAALRCANIGRTS